MAYYIYIAYSDRISLVAFNNHCAAYDQWYDHYALVYIIITYLVIKWLPSNGSSGSSSLYTWTWACCIHLDLSFLIDFNTCSR